MRHAVAVLVVAILGGCAGPREPLPITPAAEVQGAPVARRVLTAPAAPAAAAPSATTITAAPTSPIAVPPSALYVCVSGNGSQQQQTAIEFAPKVAALCKRHPEMGPCQYERDICRRSGGRVYAAGGQEITQQIEDDYDRKVLRVRFRAN